MMSDFLFFTRRVEFGSTIAGRVYLVGAGPGDPDLLTVKALRVIKSAHVILHDDLVSPMILQLAPPSAAIENVGKRCGHKGTGQNEINARMIDFARKGHSVVRLHGGDPLIFGRAGEEIRALAEAGLDFEIVPGVTTPLAAAAAVGIPLTDRRLASSVIFLTGHRAGGKLKLDWLGPLPQQTTIVIYMPGDDYGLLAAELCSAGLALETPCLIVSRASTREQQVGRTTLEQLAQAERLPSPKILIAGAVAAGPQAADAVGSLMMGEARHLLSTR